MSVDVLRERISQLESRNAFLESQLAAARRLSAPECGTSGGVPQSGVEATSTGIFARLHILHLREHRIASIGHNNSIVIEIGASDRNTMDKEFLPQSPMAYLITCEPVIDKYARALSRNAKGAGDQFQKLGRHHSRGVVLPLAIGPREMSGVQKLHLGRNSGCSSLLSIDKNSRRSGFCRMSVDTREVPTITLETLLGWVNRTVDFIKVDAQGLDLRAIQSAYSRMSQVRSFALEVISDDCDGIYEGQPKCSDVLRDAAALGFKPATEMTCLPRFRRKAHNKHKASSFGCELNVLFVRAGRDLARDAIDDAYWQYHDTQLHGCVGIFPANATMHLALHPPAGRAVYNSGGNGPRFYGTGGHATMRDSNFRGALYSRQSFGLPYICSDAMFASSALSAAKADEVWGR